MFALGVNRLLGMNDEQAKQLYYLVNKGGEKSSFQKSIELADAVWCTDWDKYTAAQFEELSKHTYSVELQTKDPYFLNPKDGEPYPQIVESAGKPGCTSGIDDPTRWKILNYTP